MELLYKRNLTVIPIDNRSNKATQSVYLFTYSVRKKAF